MVTPEIIITPENTETLPAPSETEIIEITEVASEIPTADSTGAVPTTFNIVYNENFETEPLSNWSLGEGWTRAQTETGFALQSIQMLQRALFNPLVSDTEITFQVRWDAGRVHLHTHSSGLNEYQFSLSSDFQAILYRNGVIVATALTPEFVSVQWQTITYRKIGSNIEILLNNTPLLQYFETEPLLNGQIALSAEGMTRAQWDEMSVKSGEVVAQVLATEVPILSTTPTIQPTFTMTPTATFIPDAPAEFGFRAMMQASVIEDVFVNVATPPDIVQIINIANANPSKRYVVRLTSSFYNFDNPVNNYSILPKINDANMFIYGADLNNPSVFQTSISNTRLFSVQGESQLVLRNITIKNFTEDGNGGAIENGGKLWLYRVTMLNNGAQNGGAIRNFGKLEIYNSIFRDNNRIGPEIGGGGAISSTNHFVVQCSTFENNYATYGGAIDGRVNVIYSNFINNRTVYNNGLPPETAFSGAIYIGDYAQGQIPASKANDNWWNGNNPKAVSIYDSVVPNSIVDDGRIGSSRYPDITSPLCPKHKSIRLPDEPICNLNSQGFCEVSTPGELEQYIQACSETIKIELKANFTLSTSIDGVNGFSPIPNQCDLIIKGNGYTIERNPSPNTPNFRLFSVNEGGSLTLENINVRNGVVDTDGGGIYNMGTLTIQNNSAIENNRANNGGGIYNAGTLMISNATVRDNKAGLSGIEAVGFIIGDGVGGGIYNTGNATVFQSNIFKNRTDNYGGGIYNSYNLNVIGSRIERNVVVNTQVDGRNLKFVQSPANRLNGAGGGIYQTGVGTTEILGSCINLNTARNGGGVYAEGQVNAVNNWWGHINGASLQNVDGRQGYNGDAVTGNVNTDNYMTVSPQLSLPLLNGVNTQACFQLELPFNTVTVDGTWGRPDLALEVLIRSSDLIGREVELGEVLGLGIYVASNQGDGFSERDLNLFAEAIGRIYHEYNKSGRGEGASPCDLGFSQYQTLYLMRSELGLLCTLGTLSEWYGENDSAEYQALFVADTIRLGILDMATDNANGITWQNRGDWTNTINAPVRQVGRIVDFDACRNWEVGLNRDGSKMYDAGIDVQGCPWVWGNESKLYENKWASARLQNQGYESITPNNNELVEADSGPSYKLSSSGTSYDYINNPDSNINFKAISLRENQINPFYLFTIIQVNILKCGKPLVAVPSSNVASGYFPSCAG
jgi:hypothetical protein